MAFSSATDTDQSMGLALVSVVSHKEAREGSEDTVTSPEKQAAASGDVATLPKEEPIEEEEFNPLTDPRGDIQYNTMSWWHVGILMIAETVSLGILSLPSAMAAVGFVPGILLIVGLGILSTYAGYVLGQFKLAYPGCLSVGDAGAIVFGPIGREVLAWASILSFVFVMSAHILTFTVMMNVLTGHAACSIIFGFVGFFASLVLTLPRKLKDVSYISIASFASVASAVLVAMVSLALTRKGGENINLFVSNRPFASTFVSVLDMIMAYAGNVAFFGFISELKKPADYPKALILLQSVAITFYVVVAAVIYYYVGVDVKSPALTSANPVIRKISYGIALPTILVAGVINASVAAKYVYVRFWRDFRRRPRVLTQKSFVALASWASICFTLWVLAFLIAIAIPGFNNLLGFVSALFMGWLTYGVSGVLWLYLNRGQYLKNWKKVLLTAVNIFMVAASFAICALGLYASGTQIAEEKTGASFSCVDNSK